MVRRARRSGRLSGGASASAEAAVTVASLGCTARMLQQLSKFDSKIQLPTALVLLVTAEADLRGEHLTVKDLQRALGLRSETTYKNVGYWVGSNGTTIGPAHGMLEINVDPNDRRQRIIKLTRKGRTFLSQLLGGERK